MKPQRLRRSRAAGATLPPDTVYVGRGTMFGNPWRVWKDGRQWYVSEGGCHHGPFLTQEEAHKKAVDLYRDGITRPGPHHSRLLSPIPTVDDAIKYLRGRNLSCWCKLDQPCHADVLLEIANG